jgi:hypothetical protein
VRLGVPTPAGLPDRLASVLEVSYLSFNGGSSATAGGDWMRPAPCEEALRLGRILAGLLPEEPEAHGLVALMELQASRIRARADASGAAVLLADQDRRRWDRLLVRRGLGRSPAPTRSAARLALHPAGRGRRLPRPRADARGHRLGAHRRALPGARPRLALAGGGAQPRGRGRDGRRRGQGWGSPSRCAGSEPSALPQLPAGRGELLAKLGRLDEARKEFERAAALTATSASAPCSWPAPPPAQTAGRRRSRRLSS